MHNTQSRWYAAYCNKKHSERLAEIKEKSSTRVDNKEPVTRKRLPGLSKSARFLGVSDAVHRENLHLLYRLSEITGRSSSKQKPTRRQRALHEALRRREAERIQSANLVFAKRLKEVASPVKLEYASHSGSRRVSKKRSG